MKHMVLLFALLWATALIPAPAIGAEQQPLNCDTGPVNKAYGKTQWLVYSCNDNKTVVLVSAPGSPATPFVFTFYSKESGYQLHGEGTGHKEATAAAFNELKALSEQDIATLIEQTKKHKRQ